MYVSYIHKFSDMKRMRNLINILYQLLLLYVYFYIKYNTIHIEFDSIIIYSIEQELFIHILI